MENSLTQILDQAIQDLYWDSPRYITISNAHNNYVHFAHTEIQKELDDAIRKELVKTNPTFYAQVSYHIVQNKQKIKNGETKENVGCTTKADLAYKLGIDTSTLYYNLNHPKHTISLLICLELKLDLDDAVALLDSAGQKFSHYSITDIVVYKCIEQKEYNIIGINTYLLEKGEPILAFDDK